MRQTRLSLRHPFCPEKRNPFYGPLQATFLFRPFNTYPTAETLCLTRRQLVMAPHNSSADPDSRTPRSEFATALDTAHAGRHKKESMKIKYTVPAHIKPHVIKIMIASSPRSRSTESRAAEKSSCTQAPIPLQASNPLLLSSSL